MHPYNAKSNFFSEMDVLRARQSKGPRAADFHVTFVCHVWVLVWVPLLLAVLSRRNPHFCYCMRITFAYLFFSIHSNFHFICIFTSAFSCSPLPPLVRLSSDCAKVDSLCAQTACFVKKIKKLKLWQEVLEQNHVQAC